MSMYENVNCEMFDTDTIEHDVDVTDAICIAEYLADTTESQENQMLQKEKVCLVQTILKKLHPGNMRSVVEHRFGFSGNKVYTTDELASMLGVSISCIRALERRGVHILRTELKRMHIVADVLF